MIEKLTKLVDVKSLTTLCLVIVFAVLSITDRVSADNFLTVFLVIITYYFNKDNTQKNSGQSESSDLK